MDSELQRLSASLNIGIVLSGGGVRGMAHIGVLKALREFNIAPNWISGASVGAIVGALYARGNGEEDMLRFFKETPLLRYDFLSIGKPGLFDTERYYSIFSSYFPENNFERLHIPLFVNATNLQRGENRTFSKGELIKPLLASAALPPIFSPVLIDGELYSDGGIMNNFPIEPLEGKAEYILGSNVAVIQEMSPKEIRTSLQLANRTTGLMLQAINAAKTMRCHLLFEPNELQHIGVLDKKGIEQAYHIGYEYACAKLNAVFNSP
ncbi:patatin-like phospholipase family protein [Robiginitalea sp.]|nr:patatin-like phospholipase family protein [Robiginitalea sp.]